MAKINTILRDYYLSPVRNHDKETLGRNFWSHREHQELPYRKGFLYALRLGHIITARSGGRYSLDHLMLALQQQVMQGPVPDDAYLLAQLRTFSGEDFSGLHQQYINEGATIPTEPGSMGPQIADSVVALPAFELGFDFSTSVKTKSITGMVEGSAACRAGLRNGQQLRTFSVQFNNTDNPAMVAKQQQ